MTGTEVVASVVLDWYRPRIPVHALRHRVERLCQLGVDVVLVTSKAGEVDPSLDAAGRGPGQVFLVAPGDVGGLADAGPEARLILTGEVSAVLERLDRIIAAHEGFPAPVGGSVPGAHPGERVWRAAVGSGRGSPGRHDGRGSGGRKASPRHPRFFTEASSGVPTVRGNERRIMVVKVRRRGIGRHVGCPAHVRPRRCTAVKPGPRDRP